MNIKLISDIHVDYDRDKGASLVEKLPSDGVDVLVLAGDVTTGGNIDTYFETFQRLCNKYKDVIFVLGNHDHYKKSIQETHDIMSDFQNKLTNLHWLQNSKKEINGTTFVGATLWFPEKPIMPGKANWVDFRFIKNSPKDIFNEFNKTKEYLQNNLNNKDIFVCHHVPSELVVHPEYYGDLYNCYFVGDVQDVITEKKPSYVFYGHSHLKVDLTIGDTQFLLNPRGYPHEYGLNGFNPDLIIDTSIDEMYT